jgi:hypothetical protein
MGYNTTTEPDVRETPSSMGCVKIFYYLSSPILQNMHPKGTGEFFTFHVSFPCFL